MPQARFEPVRSIAFGGISGAFADVGAATTHKVRVFLVANQTDGAMMITTTGAAGNIEEVPVLAGVGIVVDVSANMLAKGEENYFLPIGSQFAVKQITAPTSGSVYIACLY